MTFTLHKLITTIIISSFIATTIAPFWATVAFAQETIEEPTTETSHIENNVEIETEEVVEDVIEEEEKVEETPSENQEESLSENETEEVISSTEILSTSQEVLKLSTLSDSNDTENDENVTALSVSTSTVLTASTSGPVIVSGEAVALANILNIVNTNLVNSSGEVIFSNVFEDQVGGIDFRNSGGNGTSCGFLACGNVNGVEVNLVNDAYIDNAILVEAASGDNSIEITDASSSATIITGNAFAGLNLINIANTNFINSNYLLVTLNAFQDVYGDIIFPSLQNFFGTNSTMSTAQNIALMNSADISNSLAVTGETGNNFIHGDALSVSTGESFTLANVFNQLNTTLSGGDSISILLRVHGTWLGELFGISPGISVEAGPDGYYYIGSTGRTGQLASNASVSATSTALIRNNVRVGATTGNNEISGAKTGLISTGNAYAGANVVNIANANVIGRNWILAVINIFGDFNGNLSFGQPDIWVGEQVAVPSSIVNESELTYTFTVINNGDAPATEITLEDAYDASHVQILDSNLPYIINDDNELSWELGTLAAGEATEVTFRASVFNTGPETDITNTVVALERETDANLTDNKDTGTVRTSGARNSSRREQDKTSQNETTDSIPNQTISDIQIKRSTFSTTVTTPEVESVQEIVVINPTNAVMKSVLLHDVLTDMQGTVIKDEVWDFGDLLPHEEVTISYNVSFSNEAQSGQYGLATKVSQLGVEDVLFSNNGSIFYLPNQTIISTENFSSDQIQVLGISTTGSTDTLVVEEEKSSPGERLRDWLSPATAYASLNAEENTPTSKHSLLILLNLLFGLIVLGVASREYKIYRTHNKKG